MNQESWPYWWATFRGGREPAFVYAKGEAAAREAAAALGDIAAVKTLPYVPIGQKGGPGDLDFCHSPGRCAGRTACPQSYSCTE